MSSPILDFRYNQEVLKNLLRKYCENKIDHYVDLGCGNCRLTMFVCRVVKPRKVSVVDIDEKALNDARERGFLAFRCDFNKDNLPFDDNSIDLATAFEVLEHLWNKDHFLEEVYRILKPGGYFICSTPNLASWASRLLMLTGKLPLHYNVSMKYVIERPSYHHIALYTLPTLTAHLKCIGFEVKERKGLLFPWVLKNGVVKAFSLILSRARPSLAPDILIVSRKPT